MSLTDEIESGRRHVSTDSYQLSVGEVVNMYRDNEIVISPDFQRLFRWSIYQQSRLVESILLGIPIPPIFVFETQDGSWELIDGLQRLSTILKFMGMLKEPDSDEVLEPEPLVATKYLGSLEGAVWEAGLCSHLPALLTPIEKSEQLSIKRSRLGVQILKRPSDAGTKYDLFQRLNSGGSDANSQELRNCLVVMVNSDAFHSMKNLSCDEKFVDVIQVNESQKSKQKDIEYVMRYIVYTFSEYDGKRDVEEYIDEEIVKISNNFDSDKISENFCATFSLLHEALGGDALRRKDGNRFVGAVGLRSFETIAVGVARNLPKILKLENPVGFVKSKVEEIWLEPKMDEFSASGLRGTQRIQRTVPFGAGWFDPSSAS